MRRLSSPSHLSLTRVTAENRVLPIFLNPFSPPCQSFALNGLLCRLMAFPKGCCSLRLYELSHTHLPGPAQSLIIPQSTCLHRSPAVFCALPRVLSGSGTATIYTSWGQARVRVISLVRKHSSVPWVVTATKSASRLCAGPRLDGHVPSRTSCEFESCWVKQHDGVIMAHASHPVYQMQVTFALRPSQIDFTDAVRI